MPVFAAIGDGSAMTQKDLATLAVVEQPTMAATLSRMERDGLVERLPNPKDMRSALVSLTPAALAKAEELAEVVAEVNGLATASLTKAERAEYLRLIGKIIAALEAADAGEED
jgi:DNA-binding MarR family transcriptional regulator